MERIVSNWILNKWDQKSVEIGTKETMEHFNPVSRKVFDS